ncbi:MAG TPA: MFS transporter [Coleofasciculaceae cyanobacterium]|jgi:DHA1 family tetracycline resistance protein-like MFS transporter
MAKSTQTHGESEKKRGLPPILIIFLTVLIDMIGFGIVIPILPLYSLHFGANPWQIGLLFASFSFMQLIFAPLLGRWSDRFGRRPVLLLSILGTAIGFLVLGLANSLWLLFLGRIIDGISGGNISTAQAYIADVTPPEKRSGAMGIIGAAFGLGFVIGPTLGGLLGHYSIQLPFYVATALALLNMLAIYAFLPESLTPENRKEHPADRASLLQTALEVRNTPLGTVMLCSLLSTIAFSLVTALYTLFTADRLGWSARENGMMFAYIGLLGVLIQGGMLRRMVPRMGEKPLVIFGCILLCISMALLPVNDTLALIILASSGLAIGNSFVTPLLSGLASKSADEQSQGVALGLMQSTASLGRMLGPAIGGFLLNFDHLHPNLPYGITPFWASAVVMLLAVVASLQLAPVKHTVHISETP